MSANDVEVLERIYARWAEGNVWSFESFDEEVRARWATEVPDLENAHVWTMRDGQATAIRAYSDRGRAMHEVGLAT
jgi:hypothetical protein